MLSDLAGVNRPVVLPGVVEVYRDWNCFAYLAVGLPKGVPVVKKLLRSYGKSLRLLHHAFACFAMTRLRFSNYGVAGLREVPGYGF